MTIIEFFDTEQLENIIGTLLFSPKRTVLFGRDFKKMVAFQQRAEIILKSKGIQAEISIVTVNTKNFAAVTDALHALVSRYPDAIFDLTGGEELVLAAMGAVASEKNISMQTINPLTGRVRTFSAKDTQKDEHRFSKLSVQDAMLLFGGTVEEHVKSEDILGHETEIETLFGICAKDPNRWNMGVEQLSSFVSEFDEKSTVNVTKSRLKNGLEFGSKKTKAMDEILQEIVSAGIAEMFETSTHKRYAFKSDVSFSAIIKAGNIFELYTLLCASMLKNEKNAPFLDDAMSGAVIDWKFPPDFHKEDDVENEMDVLLTKDTIPVFISCKNGSVDSNELYKLNTVAKRFGGKYAKKVLVMTQFTPPKSFFARAQEMNIRVIKNVHLLTKEEFMEKLKVNI